MKFRFLAALLIVAVTATTYWYISTANECPTPLAYRLGQLDDHFAITPEEAKEYLTQAEQVWETAAGRNLFVYDESAPFVVDFIFDDRQALADSEAVQSAELDEKRSESEGLIKILEEMQSSYQELSSAYNTRVAAYEDRLNTYNQTVRKYNDRGGAPADEYARLQEEQEALDRESGAIQVQAEELNNLASQLNELANRSNALIEDYNRDVRRFNNLYGYEREFTQGDYDGSKINIYKFSSAAELVTVLTHEFGHALGIGHVEDESGVMYYLLTDESENPTLTEADIAAFAQVCGTGNEIQHTLRRIIRSAITAINK